MSLTVKTPRDMVCAQRFASSVGGGVLGFSLSKGFRFIDC